MSCLVIRHFSLVYVLVFFAHATISIIMNKRFVYVIAWVVGVTFSTAAVALATVVALQFFFNPVEVPAPNASPDQTQQQANPPKVEEGKGPEAPAEQPGGFNVVDPNNSIDLYKKAKDVEAQTGERDAEIQSKIPQN